MNGTPNFVLFLGHLHPLLVHLPIGLILLLAALELLACLPRFKQANANAGIILTLAVPLAIGTAACGWLLSNRGSAMASMPPPAALGCRCKWANSVPEGA